MKQPNYELYHSYHKGKKQHTGYADDYAFIIWGLLELYQTTYNTKFLEEAKHLNEYLLTHFWDQKNHGLPLRKFHTPTQSPKIICHHRQPCS